MPKHSIAAGVHAIAAGVHAIAVPPLLHQLPHRDLERPGQPVQHVEGRCPYRALDHGDVHAGGFHLGRERLLREAQGLSQHALAKKAKVTPPYITMLETGARTNPTIDTLKRLAKALKVTVGTLVE